MNKNKDLSSIDLIINLAKYYYSIRAPANEARRMS